MYGYSYMQHIIRVNIDHGDYLLLLLLLLLR